MYSFVLQFNYTPNPTFLLDPINNAVNEIDKKASGNETSGKLPKHADKLIEFISQNGKITNKAAREITGLSEARIRAIFLKLCELDIIESLGSYRDRYYMLKKGKK